MPVAGQDRTASHAVALTRALAEKPYKFDFFRAIRRLECAYTDKPRVGQSLRPVDDPIRLAQEPSMAFAPSTLSSFRTRGGEKPPRLSVLFFGLFGPNGPLPLHLTEYARERLRSSSDPTFAYFLDMFHHRMLSLFYRAWASAQPTVNYDRPDSDRFALYVGSLFGIGMPSLQNRDAVPDTAKLHYAGLLSGQTKHPGGLRGILTDFFRLPVEIEEFVGDWLELPPGSECRLGESEETGALGTTLTLGSRTWECQQKFRVLFGPLGYDDYHALLPGGESLPRLIALVRNYTGDELDWDVRLILKKEEVPPLGLDGTRRLGWTTWLSGRPFERDADDLALNPMTAGR